MFLLIIHNFGAVNVSKHTFKPMHIILTKNILRVIFKMLMRTIYDEYNVTESIIQKEKNL